MKTEKTVILNKATKNINDALVNISQAILDEPDKAEREALYSALDRAFEAMEILDAAGDRQRERQVGEIGNLLEAKMRGFARPEPIL